MKILKYILGAAFSLVFAAHAQAVAPENLAASAAVGTGAGPALIFPPVTISNGTIKLGVNHDGGLDNTLANVGLVFLPTGNDALIPGCPCEGWGAADKITGTTGFVNKSIGTLNATGVSFVSTARSAKSVVAIKNMAGKTVIQVTHNFFPSISPNLYEVRVTIKNTSAATIHALYRRVMDWDVVPTPFSEYVTIRTFGARNIVFTSDNGFASSNPLVAAGQIKFTGQATDNGPWDHGADFDFDFGMLAPGKSVKFSIFYGAASSTAGALAALTAVGAEAYSLGKPSLLPMPAAKAGSPNTFIFGFRGVGGVPGTSLVQMAPPTGTYTVKQNFDLAIISKSARRVTGLRSVILNGINITARVSRTASIRKIIGAPGYVIMIPRFSRFLNRTVGYNLRVRVNYAGTTFSPGATARYTMINHR